LTAVNSKKKKRKKKKDEEKKKMKKKKKKKMMMKKGCRTETRSIYSRIIVIVIMQIYCEIQRNIFQCFR
jgi:hypothetical protein